MCAAGRPRPRRSAAVNEHTLTKKGSAASVEEREGRRRCGVQRLACRPKGHGVQCVEGNEEDIRGWPCRLLLRSTRSGCTRAGEPCALSIWREVEQSLCSINPHHFQKKWPHSCLPAACARRSRSCACPGTSVRRALFGKRVAKSDVVSFLPLQGLRKLYQLLN